MNKLTVCMFLILLISLPFSGCISEKVTLPTTALSTNNESNNITDMRGVQVTVPKNITRAAVISDGFVECMMISLGVQDTIVAVGTTINTNYTYAFPSVKGENYTYDNGKSTMLYLDPSLNDAIRLTPQQYNVISYETLASSNPDVIILRVGDCSVGWDNRDTMNRTIDTMEALGIPVIVLYSPTYYSNSDLSSIREEMKIIGQIFGKEKDALELADYIQSTEKMISDRTKDIPEASKPTVLYFGLSPNARKAGGSGHSWGIDTPESYTIEGIVHAKNAYRDTGSSKILNTEQVLAMNPDIILLATSWGYHPTRELYEAPYYQNLKELRAIKNKKVYSMPWTPSNCARRLEYPIDLMITAKACYPDKFQDIKVHEWVLDFYKHVYHVDDETARGLRSAQWLDWMEEEDF
ncbi:ABC transporter, solute-binding protein [Methanosarcina barkeri str. Wiesmoor]|uniref:ABC transporter, solute-binding protein n=2 Tax=Methanosarcina barkeri TaxID=2208 RepID=A0A0E3QQL6_METBA|nr:iron ABC transporter substrate-binding protein [Methanosarcina barkeri]AKB52800.1 ABC transporter, solute-binding protein [Methanosarcina barkeri str. Wiesmoor]